MKNIYIVVIVFVAISNLCLAQGTWTQKASFPGLGKEYPFSFSVGTKGYSGTGIDSVGAMARDFWEFDPATNVWTQKADFAGGPRFVATGFSIGTKGYAGLGDDSTFTERQDFYEYDPATNVWTAKANFGGSARRGAVGFTIGSMGYICTGGTFTYDYDLWQYNPVTDTWAQKNSMPATAGRTESNGFAIGTNGYIIAGWNGGNLADLWEYNSITDIWSAKASLPATPRCDGAAFTICDKGYYGTGDFVNGTYAPDLWQYDPLSNTWTQKANFPGTPRDEPAFFTIGNKGYIGLGGTGPQFSDFYEFTPDSACSSCALTPNFNSSDTAFCDELGQCISFTDLSLSNCTITSWQWRFPGATPDTSTQQNPINICYYTPGTYPVTLIVTNSSGTDSLVANPLIIFANLPPPPTISVIGGDTLISSHGAAYQWYLNGSPIAGATDSFYVATQGGTYSVQVTNNLGCTSLSGGFIEGNAVNEIGGSEQEFVIYPNPVSDEMTISFNSTTSNPPQADKGDVEIIISDMVGQEIEKMTLEKSKAGYSLATSALSNGLYVLRIAPYGIVQKFVVMHK